MMEYINSYEHKKDEPSDNEKINFSELDLSKSENIAICSVAIAGALSEYSAPTVASLLRQATASFADIISDSKIDQGTLNYFAGNIRPNIKNIDQAP